MHDLIDRTFWRFVSGFVLILLVSISLLTFSGAYKVAKEGMANIFEGVNGEETSSH